MSFIVSGYQSIIEYEEQDVFDNNPYKADQIDNMIDPSNNFHRIPIPTDPDSPKIDMSLYQSSNQTILQKMVAQTIQLEPSTSRSAFTPFTKQQIEDIGQRQNLSQASQDSHKTKGIAKTEKPRLNKINSNGTQKQLKRGSFQSEQPSQSQKIDQQKSANDIQVENDSAEKVQNASGHSKQKHSLSESQEGNKMDSQANASQSSESQKQSKKSQEQRNGKLNQSQTQKIIALMSLYHFSKNYRQLVKTIFQMTREKFENKLKSHVIKINKNSKFIDGFKNKDEIQLVTAIYKECVRYAFTLMFESEMRNKKNENKIEIPSSDQNLNNQSSKQQNNQSAMNPCLDKQGNNELKNSFKNLYEKVFNEFKAKNPHTKIEKVKFRQELIIKIRTAKRDPPKKRIKKQPIISEKK